MGRNLLGRLTFRCGLPRATIWFADLAPKKERNKALLRQVTTHLALEESTFAPQIEYVRQQPDSDISTGPYLNLLWSSSHIAPTRVFNCLAGDQWAGYLPSSNQLSIQRYETGMIRTLFELACLREALTDVTASWLVVWKEPIGEGLDLVVFSPNDKSPSNQLTYL